jgi:hypothetical protein
LIADIQAIKRVETDNFIGTLRSDGIAHIHIKANTVISIEVQQEMERVYNELTTVPRPFLFTGDEFVAITSEARTNAVAMEMRVPISVSAIVVNNLAQRIIADYYYKFNKPKNPYKVFTKVEKAVLWIKENHNLPPI